MEQIISYIEANRATYTRDAITGQLLTRGFNPTDIVEGWRIVELRAQQGQPPLPPGAPYYNYTPPKSVVNFPAFWLTLVGFVIGVPVVTGLIAGLAGGLRNSGILAFLICLGLALIGAIVGMVVYWSRNRPFSRGLIWGLGITFLLFVVPPFIGLFIVGGVCTFSGGNASF